MSSTRIGALAPALAGLAAVGVLISFSLGRPFGNGDEVIYAQNVREMLESGGWSTLHWQGVPVLQRPSTPFVCAAALSRLWPGEVGLRLSSFLFCMATLALCYAYLRTRYERTDVAVVGLLLCAGIPTFLAYDHLLMSDPAFVFGTTLAAVGLLRSCKTPGSLRWAAAGLGWAVACKSLAAAIPALALAPLALWIVFARAGARGGLQALGILLALGLPYYVVGLSVHGTRFFHEHIVYSLWRRATGDIGTGSIGDGWFYLRWLWHIDGQAPTICMAAGAIAATWLGVRRRMPELAWLGVAPPFMLGLYSALGSRLPHYILPLYPLSALAVASAYAELSAGALEPRRLLRWAAPALSLLLLSTGLGRSQAESLLLYDDRAVALGRLAASHSAPDEPVFVHEWYAPAVAYYAGRPLRLTTASDESFAVIRAVDFFVAARVPVRVPPAPLPARAPFLVVGAATELAAARWLRVERVLGERGGMVLARASAR